MCKTELIGFIYIEPRPENLRYEHSHYDSVGSLIDVRFPKEAKGGSYSQVGLLFNGLITFPGTEGYVNISNIVNHWFDGYCSECGNANLMFTAPGALMAVCAECGAILKDPSAYTFYTKTQAMLRAMHVFWSIFDNYENNSWRSMDYRRKLALNKFDSLINLKNSKKYFII